MTRRVPQEKDGTWGPAQQQSAGRGGDGSSGGATQQRTSVVRSGNAANTGAAERRPLLPKHKLKIDSEL